VTKRVLLVVLATFVSVVLIVLILFGALFLYSLFFAFISGSFDIPYYKEYVSIDIEFSEEIEFRVELPVVVQKNASWQEVARSFNNLSEKNGSGGIKFEIIEKSVTISNQTALLTLLVIEGQGRKASLSGEYHFQPPSQVSHERVLFITRLSGLDIRVADHGATTLIPIYYLPKDSNLITALIVYSYRGWTNYCSTDFDLNRTLTGESFEILEISAGVSCA